MWKVSKHLYIFNANRLISTIPGAVASTHRPDIEIKSLVEQGRYDLALSFYQRHVHPFDLNTDTAFIVPSIARACGHSQVHEILGFQVHCKVVKHGLDSDFTVSNSIMSMYSKFLDMESARKMFDEMADRDTISWNGLVNGYVQNGLVLEALIMFKEMYKSGFVPKPELIAGVVSACVKSENWGVGRAIHAIELMDERIKKSIFVSTALLALYWRFDDPDMAIRVFDRMEDKNEVSWTTMVSGCVDACEYTLAFSYIRAMQVQHIKPNRVTLMTLLRACADLGSRMQGNEIHGYAIRHGFNLNEQFSSALVHMYCECKGGLKIGQLVFENSGKESNVMWGSIIVGRSRRKDTARDAILLFGEMQMNGIQPNDVIILAVISACANLTSFRDGCRIHGCSLKLGLVTKLFIQNALINMYSRCGGLESSILVFDEMGTRDQISWSSLISAYGLCGHADIALQVFNEMLGEGIKADAVTYLAVLTTCNHAGFVEEGEMIFDQAVHDTNVPLTVEHYGCYIDLLGRAGRLEAASDIISTMPTKSSARIWSSLVFACKLHGRLDIAQSLAHKIVSIEPENAANHRLVGMLFAESDNWAGMEEVWRCMKSKKLRKKRSFSRIFVG